MIEPHGVKVFEAHAHTIHADGAAMVDQMAHLQYEMALHFLRVLAGALEVAEIGMEDSRRVQEYVALALVPNPADAAERARRHDTVAHILATRQSVW